MKSPIHAIIDVLGFPLVATGFNRVSGGGIYKDRGTQFRLPLKVQHSIVNPAQAGVYLRSVGHLRLAIFAGNNWGGMIAHLLSANPALEALWTQYESECPGDGDPASLELHGNTVLGILQDECMKAATKTFTTTGVMWSEVKD